MMLHVSPYPTPLVELASVALGVDLTPKYAFLRCLNTPVGFYSKRIN